MESAAILHNLAPHEDGVFVDLDIGARRVNNLNASRVVGRRALLRCLLVHRSRMLSTNIVEHLINCCRVDLLYA